MSAAAEQQTREAAAAARAADFPSLSHAGRSAERAGAGPAGMPGSEAGCQGSELVASITWQLQGPPLPAAPAGRSAERLGAGEAGMPGIESCSPASSGSSDYPFLSHAVGRAERSGAAHALWSFGWLSQRRLVSWATGSGGGPGAHLQAARAQALEAAFSDEDDYFDLGLDLQGASPVLSHSSNSFHPPGALSGRLSSAAAGNRQYALLSLHAA